MNDKPEDLIKSRIVQRIAATSPLKYIDEMFRAIAKEGVDQIIAETGVDKLKAEDVLGNAHLRVSLNEVLEKAAIECDRAAAMLRTMKLRIKPERREEE